MSFAVFTSEFDLVIAAGPGMDHWPSVGAQTLSSIASSAGLKCGVFGGDSLRPMGVLRPQETGGILLVEDVRKRVHRVSFRSLVRVTPSIGLPDPFVGWMSEGMLPIHSAEKMILENSFKPSHCVVILGTGNRALRFGRRLFELGCREVVCVESFSAWGGKRFSGWEVNRRIFETLGGRIIEGKPSKLTRKAAQVWEIKIEDDRGLRVFEVDRVIGAGPFSEPKGVREFPPASLLFELESTSPAERSIDIDGWATEEERARWLSTRIIRSLVPDLGEFREEFERQAKRARIRLKRLGYHREKPHQPAYQGKWISPLDAKTMRGFSGIPKSKYKESFVASIECFENILCNVCERACPEGAIKMDGKREQVLNEALCTGCGICVSACPSKAIPMLHEKEGASTARVVLPSHGAWKTGELATLLNRRGEALGSGRIIKIEAELQRAEVEIPAHLLWEARGIKKARVGQLVDDSTDVMDLADRDRKGQIEWFVNGEKRIVRKNISIHVALYESGLQRPEDILGCPDGSCGLCQVEVDGVRKLACQTPVHEKMSVKTKRQELAKSAFPEVINPEADPLKEVMCACMGVTLGFVVDRVRQGNLSSADAVQAATRMGEGRCHGRICGEALRRLLEREGVSANDWVDWRFPWMEWVISPSKSE